MIRLKKHDVLVGVIMCAIGVVLTFAGFMVHDHFRQPADVPLHPGSGDTKDTLMVAWLPDTVKRWRPQLEKYGREYGIDPNLMAIMMTVESGGDPHADSGAAKGLMQITPSTAEDINNRLMKAKRPHYDLTDPETSLEFSAVYLRYLINLYGASNQGPSWDETVSMVAAGYNGGPTAANLYRSEKWEGLSRYDQQTFNYTRFVRVMWQERHDPLSFAYRYWHDTANGKALIDNAGKYTMPKS